MNNQPCQSKIGRKGRKYQPMAFDEADVNNAVELSTHNYVLDGSPDRLNPIGNTGYISDSYH